MGICIYIYYICTNIQKHIHILFCSHVYQNLFWWYFFRPIFLEIKKIGLLLAWNISKKEKERLDFSWNHIETSSLDFGKIYRNIIISSISQFWKRLWSILDASFWHWSIDFGRFFSKYFEKSDIFRIASTFWK